MGVSEGHGSRTRRPQRSVQRHAEIRSRDPKKNSFPGGAAGCLALGLVANETSIAGSWAVAAAIFALAAPGYLRLRKLALQASPASPVS